MAQKRNYQLDQDLAQTHTFVRQACILPYFVTYRTHVILLTYFGKLSNPSITSGIDHIRCRMIFHDLLRLEPGLICHEILYLSNGAVNEKLLQEHKCFSFHNFISSSM